MKTFAKLMLAGACAVALTGAAVQAQPTSGRATLYELPNFQGRSMTVNRSNSNLGDTTFNDVAMSAHFDGDWTVCTDADFRGNCQTVAGDVANLSQYGLSRSISSLQQGAYDPYGQSGGGYGGRGDGPRTGGGYPGAGGGDYNGPTGNGRDDGTTGYQGSGGNQGGYGGNQGGYGGNQGGYGGQYDGGTAGRSAVFFPRPKSNGQDIAATDRSAADWFCRQQGLNAAIYYDVSTRGRGFRFNGGGFSVNAPVLRDVLCRK